MFVSITTNVGHRVIHAHPDKHIAITGESLTASPHSVFCALIPICHLLSVTLDATPVNLPIVVLRLCEGKKFFYESCPLPAEAFWHRPHTGTCPKFHKRDIWKVFFSEVKMRNLAADCLKYLLTNFHWLPLFVLCVVNRQHHSIPHDDK